MKDVTGSSTAVTCQVPGARGLDWMQKTTGSGTVVAYPVYDAHGNMIATLSRSGSASYAVNDQRSYDAWGGIRSGNTSGDRKHQHCANLGHVADDDESALIYMRARSYDGCTGRYLSEDPSHQGDNWFGYCAGNPVSRIDNSGKSYLLDFVLAGIGCLLIAASVALELVIGIIIGAALLILGLALGVADAIEIAAATKEITAGSHSLAMEEQFHSIIDEAKEHGAPAVKILAANLELDFWLVAALDEEG